MLVNLQGPFANYTLHTGPGTRDTEHCITRRISNSASRGSSQANIDSCLQLPTYARAWPCIEGRPHSGGHSGVGGEMQNPISSPGGMFPDTMRNKVNVEMFEYRRELKLMFI